MDRAFVIVLLAISIAIVGQAQSENKKTDRNNGSPIIDMHVHAYSMEDPLLGKRMPNPTTGKPSAATNAREHLELTLAAMRQHNVVKAVVIGGFRNHEVLQQWKAVAPDRIIPSLGFNDPTTLDLNSLRQEFVSGRWSVMGEIGVQYVGLSPDDPKLEPYFALAEELDIPVGIHMGPGPPGASYTCCPKYRARLSSPLLLEEALIRHPKLRIYIMHAGWPMLDELMALMFSFPKVYVDLSAVNWIATRKEFHTYLRRLVEAGFGKRLMFGSDQMFWPEAIGMAIDNITSADFLTEEQKRDIFYNNAARFLRL
jgi:predicted TIM-barrel fold metal-dependent hydrolase